MEREKEKKLLPLKLCAKESSVKSYASLINSGKWMRKCVAHIGLTNASPLWRRRIAAATAGTPGVAAAAESSSTPQLGRAGTSRAP